MRSLNLGWKILWPVLWYLLMTGAAAFLSPGRFSVLEVAGIAAAVTAATIFTGKRLYEGRVLTLEILRGGKAIAYGWLLIPTGITACIMLNGLLMLSGLESPSGMYDGNAEIIYASAIWEQLLISCVLIPFTEELVFREMGFGRLRKECSFMLSAILTAFLFGFYHLQLVQGIYAIGLGMLLAAAYEKCGGLAAAFLVHAVSNLTSVVLTLEEEKSWIWEKKTSVFFITLISGMILLLCIRKITRIGKADAK